MRSDDANDILSRAVVYLTVHTRVISLASRSFDGYLRPCRFDYLPSNDEARFDSGVYMIFFFYFDGLHYFAVLTIPLSMYR